MKKKYFLFIFLLFLFLTIPKKANAQVYCSVTDSNWNAIASSSGNGCESLFIPYNRTFKYIDYYPFE